VGITHYAQEQLGDVVFVELPKVGAKVSAHQSFGVVESVKAVSDLFAPLSGEIAEINTALPNAPQSVNEDPYGRGWMILLEPSRADEWDELLTAAQYEQFLAEGH
jgi:glycine cleavage system H protein